MWSTTKGFTLFGSLPAELRLEIWKLSCQPRVVEVRYDAATDRCHTAAKPPAILQVCQESRDEGQVLYKKAFRTRRRQEYIYFFPSLDILYLPRCGLMGYDDSARDFTLHVSNTSNHVWNLAIDHVKTDIIRPWEPYNKFCLIQSFPNIRNTFLVVGTDQDPEEHGHGGEIELVDPKGDTASVIRLIDNVIESFGHEIKTPACEEQAWSAPHIPSLVPKVLHAWEGPGSGIRCI